MDLRILTDILEVLRHCLRNTDLTDSDTQSLHQFHGIVISTVCCSETRHRDADDTLAVESEFVESLHGDKQGQRRIEATADADHDLLGIDMIETFAETCYLDAEYLLTGILHILGLRDKRMGIDGTLQLEVALGSSLAGNLLGMGVALGIDECRILTTLRAQTLHIHLTHLDLRLEAETLALCQQMSILEDHRVAAIDHILCRFAETAAGIDVGTDGACTLLREQPFQIGMLADELVAGREVEDDVGTRQSEVVAGRYRSPDVFAYLHTELHAVGCHKQFGVSADIDESASKVE